MYVVRRVFRNYGLMMTPGSIVEPGVIKRFKSRLNEGRIVEVNEHNFEHWKHYFKERMGVDIEMPEEQSEEHSEEPSEDQSEEPPVTVKPIVRVVPK